MLLGDICPWQSNFCWCRYKASWFPWGLSNSGFYFPKIGVSLEIQWHYNLIKILVNSIAKKHPKQQQNNLILKCSEDLNRHFFQRRYIGGQKVHGKVLTNHQGNANQNHHVISPHTCQYGFYKKKKRQEITSIGKSVEKKEPFCIIGGNVNWYSHYGKP